MGIGYGHISLNFEWLLCYEHTYKFNGFFVDFKFKKNNGKFLDFYFVDGQ